MNNYNEDLNKIYNEVTTLIEEARKKVYNIVNTETINLAWNIGKYILELQENKPRAEYGTKLLEDLSIKLTNTYGKGYSIQNLRKMRQIYMYFPIRSTMSSELNLSHYTELIRIKNKQERDFYMNECVNSNWDVRTLRRQIKSCLYERLMLSRKKDNQELLPLEGNKITTSQDIIKETYILEFLDIKSLNNVDENELEENIIKHLKEFMLELGKGFMFVGRQVRVTIDDIDYYVDLVFYNRILKCHVLIDLKTRKITHKDIGQMSMYVNYYDKHIRLSNENPTIGIILGADKNKGMVKLTIPKNSEIYASTYKLYLPNKEDLIRIIEEERRKYNEKVEDFSKYL